jgi:transcriptional regulator with XRE-family HTH domain
MLKGSEPYEAVQDLLRELRMAAGLRQSDVADRLNAPQSFVSKYEAGERRLDIIEVRTLCSLFGISLPDFIARLEKKLAEREK